MNDEKGKRIGVRCSLAVGTTRDTLMYAMFRAWQALGEHVSSIVMGLPFWIKTEPNLFGFPTQPTLVVWPGVQ